ncbi:MAG: anti-sigma factor [Rhodobacteraceae bacterium]|nr:MAG: anti-sigma factor [Paracoccaceae bacterium]
MKRVSMASAHPTDDMLASYATGAASPGVALLVAAHLTYCARCRARVAAMEAVGGALLATSPADCAPPRLESVMARLDGARADRPKAKASGLSIRDPILPGPIRDAFGAPLSEIRWRFRMPGVSECELPGTGPERVSLLRVRPGAGVPAHTHTGVEATLVLSGALLDRGAVHLPGDVAVATSDDDHHPRAVDGEECVCLTVLGGAVRFTGTFGRALNIFAE